VVDRLKRVSVNHQLIPKCPCGLFWREAHPHFANSEVAPLNVQRFQLFEELPAVGEPSGL
jgi:hypothetical protein